MKNIQNLQDLRASNITRDDLVYLRQEGSGDAGDVVNFVSATEDEVVVRICDKLPLQHVSWGALVEFHAKQNAA